MDNVIIGFFVVLMIVFAVFCYACCVVSGDCSRKEEELEQFENDDSGNV